MDNGGSPVPSENTIRASGHTLVLVDEPTQPIPRTNLTDVQVARDGRVINTDDWTRRLGRWDLLS